MVSAWATENRLTLGQVAVPGGSSAIGVIPEVLRTRDLSGAIVTIDAAGCQVGNAGIVREQGGHDLLAVKGNQPSLPAAVQAVFRDACERAFVGVAADGSAAVADGHGRHEERYVTVIPDPEGLPEEWPDVAAVVPVNREREVNGANTTTSHFSLTGYAGPAAEIAGWVRGHWGDRERVARGSRRGVPGGRQPSSGGSRRGELGDAAAGRGVPARAGTGQADHPDEAAQGRLG